MNPLEKFPFTLLINAGHRRDEPYGPHREALLGAANRMLKQRQKVP